MAASLKVWITAARLRTLPLSVSGILAGSAVAFAEGLFRPGVFVLALLTTVAFQVLSNLANDYGDGVKGTDNQERIGPARALQSGALSRRELKKGILLNALLALVLAICLILVSFGVAQWHWVLLFFFLGILAIWAAVYYTVGQNAYGYRGLGDIFVFLFFGLLAVVGSYFLYTQHLKNTLWFPAIAIGLLSAGVLNLNNMRDRLSDTGANKNTLAVRLGDKGAKIYHLSLLIGALVCCVSFAVLSRFETVQYFFLLPFLLLIKHGWFVWKNKTLANLDPELKKLALSTFFISLLLWFVFLI